MLVIYDTIYHIMIGGKCNIICVIIPYERVNYASLKILNQVKRIFVYKRIFKKFGIGHYILIGTDKE